VPPVAQCVATSVVGSAILTPLQALEGVADAGPPRPIGVSEELRVDAWVALDEGSRVTSRHPRTNREIVFAGPGRFRACIYFEYPEEAWLAEGALRSVPRQIETPSAQQWLITPSGALYYDTADVEVTVTARKTTVKVSGGSVDIWTGDKASAPPQPPLMPDDPAPPGWTRALATQSTTLTQKDASPEDAAQAGIDRCLAEAKATGAIGAEPSKKGDSLRSFARQMARAACGVAALRVSQLQPSPARDAMTAKVKQGQLQWRATVTAARR
jgi:hypothetical protein